MDAKFIKGMLNSPALHPNNAINHWISAILLFDFKLVHIPAAKHTGADGLSRRPRAVEDPDAEEPDELEDWIDSNAGFFIEYNSPDSTVDPAPPMVFATASDDDAISTTAPSITMSPSRSPENSIPRSKRASRRDEKLSTIRHFLSTLQRPDDLSDDEYRLFLRQAADYFVKGSQFFRKNREGFVQLVPDPSRRLSLISYAHDKLGHKGIFATTRNILLRFWWPHLNEDVRWFINSCHECQLRQTEYFLIPPSVPLVPSLFRKAHIDTFLMPKLGSYRYVHHARDALTSYPEGRCADCEESEVRRTHNTVWTTLDNVLKSHSRLNGIPALLRTLFRHISGQRTSYCSGNGVPITVSSPLVQICTPEALSERIITSNTLLISLIDLLTSSSPHITDNSICKIYCAWSTFYRSSTPSFANPASQEPNPPLDDAPTVNVNLLQQSINQLTHRSPIIGAVA